MDLNGDGNLDILSGSYSRMSQPMAGLFQVLWGKQDGTFSRPEVLKGTDGQPLIIPAGDGDDVERICTRPFAVDWNQDGVLDLVVGNFAGSFYLFLGKEPGRFVPQAEKIRAGDQPLTLKGRHSDPFLIDWDGDGDLDLLSGSAQGGVYWSENKAGAGKTPELTPFQVLIEPSREQYLRANDLGATGTVREGALAGPAGSTRVWADDINGDGKLDILLGDMVMLRSYAEGLTEEQVKQKQAEWKKEYDQLLKDWSAAAKAQDTEKQRTLSQRLRELMASKTNFLHEEMTGFVWVYLQK